MHCNIPLGHWLAAARAACDMRIARIPFAASREWTFADGCLAHRTGGFFRVVGAEAPETAHREQPLVDQPEVGILGFLVRPGRDGGAELLVQAKPEPGNVGLVQAAPTVQATESNYRRRHGGKPTPLLERFLAPGAGVLRDVPQSEQGTRFLGKFNRNVVVAGDAPEGPGLRWFPAAELRALLTSDFAVNTDARSVLVSAPWRLPGDPPPFARHRGAGGLGEALLDSYEARAPVAPPPPPPRPGAVVRKPLTALRGWTVTDDEVRGGAFAVRMFAVTSSDREVAAWDQPLVASAAEDDVGLLAQRRGGVLRFRFRARAELGFGGRAEWGPTWQGGEAPVDGADVVLATRHSDEGGRFFASTARYALHVAPEGAAVPDGGAWLTLGQVEHLAARSGALTNEARTLVSMLLAHV